jgi:hypothetical protein
MIRLLYAWKNMLALSVVRQRAMPVNFSAIFEMLINITSLPVPGKSNIKIDLKRFIDKISYA